MKPHLDVSAFIAKPGVAITLSDWATRVPDICRGKAAYRRLMEVHVAGLSRLQDLLYASNQYAVLLLSLIHI